jgi:hypothetical protein
MRPDEDRNREKLEDYYGTAMANGFPMAVIDLGRVGNMSDDEVREELNRLGIDEDD